MRQNFLVLFFCSLLIAAPGCNRREATQPVTSPNQKSNQTQLDVCRLITNQEIEAIQGSPVRQVKNSARSDGEFRVSQCFYTAEEFSKSVSLAVTQVDPTSPSKRSPKDFWKETFGRYAGEEKDREGDKEKRESLRDQARKEEREESTPPKKINGIGDEAYWIANRVGGALYVLKNDTFIRISLGGPDSEAAKIDKSKRLAQKAVDRL